MSKPEKFQNLLRLGEGEIEKILARMDQDAAEARPKALRRSDRFEFRRARLPVIVRHKGGTEARLLLCARNLSEGGISLIHTGYVHPGTTLHVHLTMLKGEVVAIPGQVASCRYISGRLHEIGVRFDHPIDAASFCEPQAGIVSPGVGVSASPPKLCGRALCMMDDESERKRVMGWLEETGLTVTASEEVAAVLAVLAIPPHPQLILCSEPPPTEGAGTAVSQMRAAAFAGVVLALAEAPDGAAPPEGADAVLGRPPRRMSLFKLLHGFAGRLGGVDPGGPIYSALVGESGMVSVLEHYAEQVKGWAEQIKESLATGDTTKAIAACKSLASTAQGHGFPGLAGAAAQGVVVLNRRAEGGAASEQDEAPISQLLDLCARIDPGVPPKPKAPAQKDAKSEPPATENAEGTEESREAA